MIFSSNATSSDGYVGSHVGQDLLSDDLRVAFLTINYSILAAAVATFGIVTNIINIVIFCRQGIGDTINISLLALDFSDLCALLFLQLENLFRNPLFVNNVPILADEVQYLTAAWPHACFVRITSWITAYITLERCLCVIIPLKVKRVVTPTVTISSMIGIFLVMLITMLPDYTTRYVGWKFSPEYNRTMMGLIILEDRNELIFLSYTLGAVTQIAGFSIVITCSAILVTRMYQMSKWRQVSANTRSGESCKRSQKTVKMVLMVAAIYCVCYLPMIINSTASSIEPGFMIFCQYHNMYLTAWSFAFLIDGVNSSVNIIVYYRMSTKCKTTFDILFKKP